MVGAYNLSDATNNVEKFFCRGGTLERLNGYGKGIWLLLIQGVGLGILWVIFLS